MQTLVILDEVPVEEAENLAKCMEQAQAHGRVLYLGSPWPDKDFFSKFRTSNENPRE